jgi:hypothetical protein
MLSGSAAYKRGKYFGVDILTFVQRVILEGGIAPDNKITKRIATDRYNAGLHFAMAFSPCFGILATAELGTTDSIFDTEKNDTVLTLGGLVSWDLNPRLGVPLGFNLGFNYTSYPESADDLIQDIREIPFKIAYTGHREFSIALEGSYLRAPLRNDDGILASWTGLISMKYYF